MFLERAQRAAGEGAAEDWRLFPQEFRDKNEQGCYHRDQVINGGGRMAAGAVGGDVGWCGAADGAGIV
jgi:hypothetical protein